MSHFHHWRPSLDPRFEYCSACGESQRIPVAVARHSDPDTSHLAAESLTAERIRQSQAEVLRTLSLYGPMDDTELVALLRDVQSPSGVRTRRSELVRLGKVIDSGARATLKSGRRGIVWACAGWLKATG
jgi:hypothetical protein